MNKEDIKSYFDLYVLNYQPYKDIPEYQAIIKTLIDFYFNHAYNSINLPFKQAFEQQFIPIEFYEKLLLSIGFPKKIISILTNKDKKILLHSFMDYNRYKGTIEQIRLVGEKFEEEVGIYELFIDLKNVVIPFYKLYAINGKDYFNLENVNLFNQLQQNDVIVINSINYAITEKIENTIDGYYGVRINKQYIGENLTVEDFTVKRWMFIPEALYVAPNVNKVTEPFDYEKIYQGTKQYFVSAEFLTANYENENLVLPIKSNLLFLDYKKYQEVNAFNNLLAAIFLKEYYNTRIVITFEEDKQYLISLGRFVKLWYYILLKFYNYDLIDNSPINVLSLDITDINFNYVLSDKKSNNSTNVLTIRDLIEEYANLKDSDEFSQFYYNRIVSKLKVCDHVPRNLTLEEYKLMLENEVGVDLIEYLNNRISTSSSEFKEYEYNFILDELYNSLITWSIFEDESVNGNKLVPKYIGYFLKNLSFINYSLNMSPTYNLLMFLKPYHVELINELTEALYVKDVGNSVLLNTERLNRLFLSFVRASTLSISDDILQIVIYNNNPFSTDKLNDNLNPDCAIITHGRIYFLNQLIKSLNKVSADLFGMLLTYERESIAQPHSIRADHNIYPVVKSLVFVISNGFIFINKIIKDINQINLDVNNKFIEYENYENAIVYSNNINKIINFLDFDTSGYVNTDIDIDLNLVINNIFEYTDESKLLNSPLKTNNLISHSYNLI